MAKELQPEIIRDVGDGFSIRWDAELDPNDPRVKEARAIAREWADKLTALLNEKPGDKARITFTKAEAKALVFMVRCYDQLEADLEPLEQEALDKLTEALDG